MTSRTPLVEHLVRRLLLIMLGISFASGSAAADTPPPAPPIHLKIVGGLATLHQYTRNEEPFWTRTVPARTGGRVTAEIVPFDRAGIQGTEVLRLMKAGIVPYATVLLGIASSTDPEFGAADLAGLHGDIASVRRMTDAMRPTLARWLDQRYDVRLLAIYAYPAQMLFCQQPIKSLSDLRGRRVRTATPSQSDVVESLGATPIRTAFADIIPHLKAGDVSCVITGSMSGNIIGLHELTSYLYSLPITWGLSIFGVNEQAWTSLPSDVRDILTGDIGKLEREVWAESERETAEGIACNIGAPGCSNGRPGKMIETKPSAADLALQRHIVQTVIIPRWLQRCGPSCKTLWDSTLKPIVLR